MAARRRHAQIGAMRRNRAAMDAFREVMRRRGSPHSAFRRPVAPGQGLHKGWQGLDQAFEDMSGGDFTQDQITRMLAGRTPGGEHGHFTGIGPQAMKLLGGMFQQEQPDLIETEGLEGDELFRANLQNLVMQQQPGKFDMSGAILNAPGEGGGLGFLQQLLSGMEGQVLGEPNQRFINRQWPPRGMMQGRGRKTGLRRRFGGDATRGYPGARPPGRYIS